MAEPKLESLQSLDFRRFETLALYKALNSANRYLAELKGSARAIPNQRILINSLGLQEAKESSEIENIITTNDDLYAADASPDEALYPEQKEVLRYREALYVGFDEVQKTGLLTLRTIQNVQEKLLQNSAGIRKQSGTVLSNQFGETVYTPPQDHNEILNLLRDLEIFINDDTYSSVDPLIRMALIHHQFESIHPFYDGNGRTGRILNVLYLVKQGLLEIPILHMSIFIVRNKSEYYRLLQTVREQDTWEDWVLYMVTAVGQTAKDALQRTEKIIKSFKDMKQSIRAKHSWYSQDLLNNLFTHPYTRIEHLAKATGRTRQTAAKYAQALVEDGWLEEIQIGQKKYFVNKELFKVLTGELFEE